MTSPDHDDMTDVEGWLLSFGEAVRSVSYRRSGSAVASTSPSLGDRHRLRQRPRPQLFHDVVTVCLDRPFGGTERIGNLLVELAPDDQAKNFEFPRRQVRQTRPESMNAILLATPCFASVQRPLDGLQQRLPRGRLLQEILSASLHRSNACPDVALPRQKHDR